MARCLGSHGWRRGLQSCAPPGLKTACPPVGKKESRGGCPGSRTVFSRLADDDRVLAGLGARGRGRVARPLRLLLLPEAGQRHLGAALLELGRRLLQVREALDET